MDEYISIFEDIFEIKDLISENIYLNLNNKIKKILDDLENYKKRCEELGDEETSDEELSEISEEETDDEVEYEPCVCNTYWNFIPIPIEDVGKCFCMENIDRLKNCVNFNKMCEYCPLIKNIIEKQDIPFLREPIKNEMDKLKFYSIMSGLFALNNLDSKRYKIIGIFVLINFMLENFINVEKNAKLLELAGQKFSEFKQDDEFQIYLDEFGIDYDRWMEIFSNPV